MIKQAVKRALAKLGLEVRRVAVPDYEPFRAVQDALLDQRALFSTSVHITAT